MAGLVESVESFKAFSDWKKDNKGTRLSSAFVMAKDAAELEQEREGGSGMVEWLLSYYDKVDDTFTTFSSLGSRMGTKEQAFKKGRTLPELKLELVKVEVWDSIATAESVRLSKYKGEEATRVIAILQPLTSGEIFDSGSSGKTKKGSEAIPVWNLTYITSAYNILNIKIDAKTGKVLSDRMSGVMDFMQKD